MPELTLAGDARDCHFVMARMLYPNDESAAIDYFSAQMTTAFDRTGRSEDTPQVLDQRLRDAPSRVMIKAEVIKLQSRGENAGSIIWGIRGALDKGEGPSINGALRERSETLKSEARKSDGDQKLNLSIDRIKNDWMHFRSVAHLWAAFFSSFNLPHISEDHLFGHQLMLSDLPHFLAVAEDFRQFGESWMSERRGRGRYTARLLDPEVTWKVPSSYVLPDVKWSRQSADARKSQPSSD